MSKSTQENFPKLKASELIEELVFTIKMQEQTGSSVPMMVWGQPGAGKSDIIRSVGKMTNRPVIDIRLLLKDPTDLSGIPYINSDGEMGFATPADLPVSDMKADELRVKLHGLKKELSAATSVAIDKLSDEEAAKLVVLQNIVTALVSRIDMTRAIILLDELSSAPPSLQAAALQLVLDRMVGTYTLPKEVVIFAAGNRASDKTEHYEMPMPLRNRLRHIELYIDAEEWVEWAISAKVHPTVVGLIKAKPMLLNGFQDALKNMQYAFATPRTCKQLSDVLYFSDEMKSSAKVIHNRVSSIVGTGTASAFMAHKKYVHSLPSPESIALGKEKKWNQDLDMSAAYTMIINTLYWVHGKSTIENQDDKKAAEKTLESHMDNVLTYMMTNFERTPELVIMATHMAFNTFKMEYDGVCLAELIDKYGDFIVV